MLRDIRFENRVHQPGGYKDLIARINELAIQAASAPDEGTRKQTYRDIRDVVLVASPSLIQPKGSTLVADFYSNQNPVTARAIADSFSAIELPSNGLDYNAIIHVLSETTSKSIFPCAEIAANCAVTLVGRIATHELISYHGQVIDSPYLDLAEATAKSLLEQQAAKKWGILYFDRLFSSVLFHCPDDIAPEVLEYGIGIVHEHFQNRRGSPNWNGYIMDLQSEINRGRKTAAIAFDELVDLYTKA